MAQGLFVYGALFIEPKQWGVIVSELIQLLIAEAVNAAVADMSDPALRGIRGRNPESTQGGSHSQVLWVEVLVLQNLPIGFNYNVAESIGRVSLRRLEPGGHRIGSNLAGDLSSGMPPEPVAHHKQPAFFLYQVVVFVVGPDQSAVTLGLASYLSRFHEHDSIESVQDAYVALNQCVDYQDQ